MVVDDEPDLLRVVEKYLKLWKFEVEGFSDPVKALDSFQANPSRYSVILTDVRMPHMSGIELTRNMLRINPDIKIVVMTAFEVTDEMLSGMTTVSHSEILKKPFRLAEICESVKRPLHVVF